MAEIGQGVALQRKSHLLIDGSLQDMHWYAGAEGGKKNSRDPTSPDWMGAIRQVKADNPEYRIAIFHMVMEGTQEEWEGELKRRLAGREKQTGRATDFQKAVDSSEKGSATVQKVTDESIVDLIVRINTFAAPETDVKSVLISEQWKETLEAGAQPIGSNIDGLHGSLVAAQRDYKLILQSQFGPEMQKAAARRIMSGSS